MQVGVHFLFVQKQHKNTFFSPLFSLTLCIYPFRTLWVNKICNVYLVAVTRVLVSSGSGLLQHQVHLSCRWDLRHQGGYDGEEEEEGGGGCGESMQGSFRLSSLAVQLLAITWEGEERLWSNPALKASSRLTPWGSLITPPKAWISVRTNQRQPGNRNMARHSFVCEANTRQVLSTESMFDLLMRVCRSESRALLWQFSHFTTKAVENRIIRCNCFCLFYLPLQTYAWFSVSELLVTCQNETS